MKKMSMFLLLMSCSVILAACGKADVTEPDPPIEQSNTTIEPDIDLADYEIEDGILVRYIGPGGSVVVPDTVVQIGNSAFEGSKVTDVTLPDRITDIGARAFADCFELSEIDLPDSLEKIGELAFANTALGSVVFPDGLKEIQRLAFYRCSSLRYIRFPGSPLTIAQQAFNGCTTLQKVDDLLDEEWNGRIEANEQLIHNHLDPSKYVSSQSERITKLAEEITDGVGSDYESAYAISKWLEENIAIDGSKDYDSIALEPEDVLDAGKTVCEGYARLTQALLRAKGIPALHVIGILDGTLQELQAGTIAYHAWNIAYIDDHWIWMDNMYGTRWFDVTTMGLSTDYLSLQIKFSLDRSVPLDQLYDQPEEAVSGSIDPMKWEGNYSYNGRSALVNDGKGGLEIRSQSPDHAMITQVVSVRPHRDYMFSASVRLEDLQPSENDPSGACINVTAPDDMSAAAEEPHFVTSSDWTTLTISFNSGSMTSVRLCLSNGWYDDLSMGTAYFKDVTLTEIGTDGIVPSFG